MPKNNVMGQVKLMPRSVAEEYRKNLIEAGDSEKKTSAARQLVSSRLMDKFGIRWWSCNSGAVRAEMAIIEKDLAGRCVTCGADLSSK
jgi:hypothetical protein